MKKMLLYTAAGLLLFYSISCKKISPEPALPEATITATGVQTAVNTPTISPTESITTTSTITPTSTETGTYTATPTATRTSTPLIAGYFSITAPGGGEIGGQTAGIPFTISITAYMDGALGNVAEAFDGYAVALEAGNNYSSSEYCISPTSSILFVKGIATMTVTMYRSTDTAFINVEFGTIESQSNTFTLVSGPANGLLVLPEGLTHKPGLKHTGIPGYKGYEGATSVQKAGTAFPAEILIVDDNYNRVTYMAAAYPKITANDPLFTVEGLNAYSSNVYVTVTAGSYAGTDFIIRTYGTSHTKSISAELSFYPTNISPSIPFKHAAVDSFRVIRQAGDVIAGGYCGVTLAAVDAFGNTCDDYNGAIPFDFATVFTAYYGTVTSSASYYDYAESFWTQGVLKPVVTHFLSGSGWRYAFDSGAIHGVSGLFNVNNNSYNKIVFIPPGMSIDSGNNANNYVSGTADTALANNAYNVSIYGCDYFSNVDTTVNHYFLISSTGAGDTIDGVSLPVYITVTAGTFSGSMIFPGTGARTLTVIDADNAGINPAVNDVLVQ